MISNDRLQELHPEPGASTRGQKPPVVLSRRQRVIEWSISLALVAVVIYFGWRWPPA